MLSLFHLVFDYICQLILLVKRYSSYIGLANRQNFEDTFYQLLHDKNYDEALKLAQQYDFLDMDLVYKCKWRGSGITVQSINLVMSKIQDKLWIINDCVKTVPISYEACRRLIEFGLDEANLRLLYELGYDSVSHHPDDSKHGGKLYTIRKKEKKDKRPLLDDNISDRDILGLIDFDHLTEQQKELCRCRQRLLRYQHSLIAYKNILGDRRTVQQNFDHVFYDEFRKKCPLNNCIDYAHNGDSHAVETCLNFYTKDLSPHILAILSHFPETLSPYQYRNLLPCLRDDELVFEWRPKNQQLDKAGSDWSQRDESSSIEAFLRSRTEAYEEDLYKTNADLKKYIRPLTSELLSEWFIERALEMESKTLLLINAIQLVQLGSELRIKNLKTTLDGLAEFEKIIYDYCSEKILYLSYSQFIKMTESARLLLIFDDSIRREAKYKMLALSLVYCDLDANTISKMLTYVMELRRRDEKIQMAYLIENME